MSYTDEELDDYLDDYGGFSKSGGKSSSMGKEMDTMMGKSIGEEAENDFSMLHDDDSSQQSVEVLVEDDQEGINPNGIPLNEHVVAGEEDFNNDGFLNIMVNTQMRDQFKRYCDDVEQNMLPDLTHQQERGVRLLNILRKKNTTLDTYDGVMKWYFCETGVLDWHDKLKDAGDEYISRTTLLADLAKRYHMVAKFPFVKPVKLPYSRQNIDLVCHDAWGCFESLLTDPRLTDDDFWFFDDDPFADPPENVATITDLHTGLAYREAHKQYKKKPNQIVLPIVLYLDGANTGAMKNMPITALKMTLGIFTRKYRELDEAWRVLGHVHSVSKNQAKGKKLFKRSGHVDARGLDADDDEDDENSVKDPAGPSKDLHKMLDVMLESYREVQEKGFKWDLRYRGKTYDVEFVPFVIFLKCDTQEGDMLCGSYTNRTKNVKQLCRYCTCPNNETDNPQARYDFKTVPMIKALVDAGDLEGLKAISQHCFDNAFYKIRFSPISNRGIHGATPSEMLHAVLLGNFAMTRDNLFEQIGDDSKCSRLFQGLAMLYGKLCGRQSERNLPKCSFNSGIREGKLNAKEYRGILLVMAMVFRSSDGTKALRNHGFSQRKVQDWLNLLEIILAWEAFLTEPAMTKAHVAMLSGKNRHLIWLIKKVAPRKTGMGLLLMKLHAITHIFYDIMLDGVPMEVDTGANESGHKATKHAARSTQKNDVTFDIQTATRITEHHVLDLAMEELSGRKLWRYNTKSETCLPDPVEAEEVIVTGGTKINIFEDDVTGEACFSLGEGAKARVPRPAANWDRDVVPFLSECQEKLKAWTGSPRYKLKILTEQRRNGQIFRGHPSFRGDKHWRDWALIQWGEGDPEPAQIWCFVDLNDIVDPDDDEPWVHGNCQLHKGVFAVVECATYRKRRNNELTSHFFEPLVKEMRNTGAGLQPSRKFYLVDTEAIADPCFVIPDVGSEDGRTYFRVKRRDDWVQVFEDWLHEPYPEEYKNDLSGLAFD